MSNTRVASMTPHGDSLPELSEQMQGEVDRLAPQRVWERFATEEPALRPLPELAFEARRLRPVSVSRSALVRVEGAWYSVLERWAGLSVTAWVGVEEVTLSLGTERVSHPRQRFGGRRVSYRHYLGELSRKPQALAGATRRSTSGACGGGRHTPPAPTRRRSCTRRGRGRRRNSATWAICSPRTATAWCWTSS